MFLINATYKLHVVKVPFLDEIIDDMSIQACSALKISALTKKELASFTTSMIITAYQTQIALTQRASVKFQAEIASRENLSAHVVALIAQIVQIARSFFPNRSQKKDANTSSATPQSYFTGQVPMIKQESSLSLQNIKTFEQKSLIQNSPPKIHPKKTKPHQIENND